VSLLLQFVLAVAVILGVAWAVGRTFAAIGQPTVMGEVIGGVFLGPSCLGWIAPGFFATLFPAAVITWLGAYAQFGIILYMFVVGLDVDLPAARKRGAAVVVVAQCGFWVPFLCGGLFAARTRLLLGGDGAPPFPFALFFGLALAVTAFPLLARMLRDARVDRTKVGSLALASAAVGDVTVWCLLAVVVGIARGTPRSGLSTFATAVLFLAFLWWVGAPAASRILERWYQTGQRTAALCGLAVVLAAAAWGADTVGIHALFGSLCSAPRSRDRARWPLRSPRGWSAPCQPRVFQCSSPSPVCARRLVHWPTVRAGCCAGRLWRWRA
jgi:Kef-type K+ transport system membrane component KefB